MIPRISQNPLEEVGCGRPIQPTRGRDRPRDSSARGRQPRRFMALALLAPLSFSFSLIQAPNAPLHNIVCRFVVFPNPGPSQTLHHNTASFHDLDLILILLPQLVTIIHPEASKSEIDAMVDSNDSAGGKNNPHGLTQRELEIAAGLWLSAADGEPKVS